MDLVGISRRFPSETQAENSFSVSSLQDGGACVHEKYISQQKERFSNEAGRVGSGGGVLHVFQAARPCLHTARCLTAAGDGGESGEGAVSITHGFIIIYLRPGWFYSATCACVCGGGGVQSSPQGR